MIEFLAVFRYELFSQIYYTASTMWLSGSHSLIITWMMFSRPYSGNASLAFHSDLPSKMVGFLACRLICTSRPYSI